MKRKLSRLGIVLMTLSVGLLAGGEASAVQLNPDGFGEVLIYPYYNVQSDSDGQAYNSLLSLTNTSEYGKAVKIRIREGWYGDEVISFNLLMAPRDMWTAALAPEGTGMKIVTSDTTCARLAIGTSGLTLSLPGENAERVQSGYIEVIEMGAIQAGSPTSKAVTHVQTVNGRWVPPDCAKGFQGVAADLVAQDAAGKSLAGGLTGSITLVNVQSGFSFSAKAVALGQFAKAGTVLGYSIPEDSKPNLTSAEPVSIVPGQGEETQLISQWEAGTADAVSAVLMHSTIINEYITERSTASKTDWVMTFPTKPYYYDKQWTVVENGGRKRYVTGFFQRDMAEGVGACDDYREEINGREEEIASSGGILMPPRPSAAMCRVNQAISFIGPASGREKFIFPRNGMITSPFENGYGVIAFYQVAPITSSGRTWVAHQLNNDKTTIFKGDGTVLKDQTRTYTGLPIVGFAAHTYNNATIPLADGKVGRSIYGVTVPHSYLERIEQ